MVSLSKQIEYWRVNAENDIDTAQLLIKAGKFIEEMFFCHLCIEKIIKALIVKATEQIPPKSHDLFYLAEGVKMELTELQSDLMQILMKYQLEGRYPEYYPKAPSAERINDYLIKSKELFLCFSKML